MKRSHTIVGFWLSLVALVLGIAVAGCGGGGGKAPRVITPPEQIVAQVVSPTATPAAVASAVKASFGTLGTSDTTSPLYGMPADSTLASIVANQQVAANGGNTSVLGTLAQAHVALGTSMPTLEVFLAQLNSFVGANYSGSNQELRSLARLIVLNGETAPETPPTLTAESKLQPFQAYYVAIWSLLEFDALVRDGMYCEEARRFERLVKFYETFPFSLLISDRDLANLREKAQALRKKCHSQS